MKRPVFQSRRALRDLRLRAGLTERALGARLGVTAHTIRAWEKGVGRLGQEWRFKLAGALGCSVADLRDRKPADN
jgi:transcriptional regulator with XRE-family HTH domain